jgi:acyl-coenzyme A thioesterase PaaI-like protein
MDHAALEAAGWRRLPTLRFSAAIGPTFMRGDPGAIEVALLAGAELANDNIGIVHGGALLTFADIAFGCAVAGEIGGAHCVTTQLQYQFTGAARVGDLITCRPEIVRRTSQLVFVRGLVMAGERVAGSADGIFKVLDGGKLAGLRGDA